MSVMTRREQQRKLGLFTAILGFVTTSALFVLGCVYLPIIIPSFMTMGALALYVMGAMTGGGIAWLMTKSWENPLLLTAAMGVGAVFGVAFVGTILFSVLPLMAFTVISLITAGGLLTAVGAGIFHIIGDCIFNRVSPGTQIDKDEELDTSLEPEAEEVEYGHQQQQQQSGQVLTLHKDSVTKTPQPSSTASIFLISSAHSTPQSSMTSLSANETSISGSGALLSMSLGDSSIADEDSTPRQDLDSEEEHTPRPGWSSRAS